MPDVITMGEALIDFVPTVSGVSLVDVPGFGKAAGGAPANVAVGLSKLGVSSGFMGKVGDDAFGHYLAQTLGGFGVDVGAICFTSAAPTALAFVSLQEGGERDFMFYRHPSADMLYTPDEIDEDYVRSARVLHVGSISLIEEPSRSATMFALQIAVEADLLVSYDPNLRLNLWPNAAVAKESILSIFPLVDVIKLSKDELVFLTGQQDLLNGAKSLWHDQFQALVITKGREGCSYLTRTFSGSSEAFSVESVNSTGAGDGFMAGLLKGFLSFQNAYTDEGEMQSICEYANAVGAFNHDDTRGDPGFARLRDG